MVLVASAQVDATDLPRITAIHFEGNRVTQERILLREMALAVGDPADPVLIEQGRQAILDLGLYRSVIVSEARDGEGVALTVTLREKRYLLVVPRLGGSSDGERSYGAQIRWNNLWGLGHNFNLYAERGDHEGDRLRVSEDLIRLTYNAPRLISEQESLFLALDHTSRVVPGAAGNYDETIASVEFVLSKDFRDSRPRKGWITSAGILWEKQDTAGPFAPPSDGAVTAILFGAIYDDVRFHIYSESGRQFSTRMAVAVDGWFSDYGYRRLDLRYIERLALDSGEHHSLHLTLDGGWANGGRGRQNSFSLGGSRRLRGYGLDFIEGERFVYAAAEYLRPVFGVNWLRLLVLAEAGWTGGTVIAANEGGPYSNIGVGVRLRLTRYVNVEVDIGIAYPLRGGDGSRFFAGGG